MRRQPKYKFLKNWGYAVSGFFEVLKNETAFKLELIVFSILVLLLILIKIPFLHKIAMISSVFIVIITELLNSSIERTVDLVTKEYHILAKHAKDAASGGVMFSNFLATFIWISLIYLDRDIIIDFFKNLF
jgi:diacylglycerol kinase (ATP)